MTVLGTAVVIGVVLSLICVETHLTRRESDHQNTSKGKRRNIMARLRSRSRTPEPYAPCGQTTSMLYDSSFNEPDGIAVLPTITLTTPEAHGNPELVQQTKKMGQTVHDPQAPLQLPPRRLTSRTRRLDEPSAYYQHNRPSYSLRLCQSQPPTTVRLPSSEERSTAVSEDEEVQEPSSPTPATEDRHEESVESGRRTANNSSPRAASQPVLASRLPESVEASMWTSKDGGVELNTPLTPIKDDEVKESVDRGRRTTKESSRRVESTADSGSWKRRGRSRGPRPKSQEEEQKEDVDNGQAGYDEAEECDEQEHQVEAEEDEEDGGERQESGVIRLAGWVPAAEPESEK